MTTFADTFKGEIARVARKVLKADLQALRKTLSTQRTEIASLKKQLKAVSAKAKPAKSVAATTKEATPATASRRGKATAFGPATLADYRAKVGISQAQMASLIGASTLSVHKWEKGKATPRAAQLAKISEVLKLGKRAALAKLAS